MTYTMESLNSPEGVTTIARPQEVPFQKDDEMLSFLRNLAFRRAQASSRPRPAVSRQAPPAVQAPAREGDTSTALKALQLRRAQAQEQDENDVRNMRKVPVNTPGQSAIYGLQYDWDTRGANPIQQRAVSPQNATFEGAGAFNPTARPQGADDDWLRFLNDVAARRAIGANGGF